MTFPIKNHTFSSSTIEKQSNRPRLTARVSIIRWSIYICLTSLAVGLNNIQAQDRLELGGFIGASYYLGDLNPAGHFAEPHLAFGAIGRYVLNDRWALKASITKGALSGSYPNYNLKYPETSAEGYSFKRNIYDAAAMWEFNFLSYDHKFISNSVFTPYIAIGLATSIYQRYDRESISSNGGMDFILSLPFGVGVKYKLTDWIRVGAEWTMRKTFADDLDYTGGQSAINPSDPYGFNTSHALHNNDWYSFAGVTVSFNMVRRKTVCNSGI